MQTAKMQTAYEIEASLTKEQWLDYLTQLYQQCLKDLPRKEGESITSVLNNQPIPFSDDLGWGGIMIHATEEQKLSVLKGILNASSE